MLTTRTIYYTDWNIMMESTRKDIEFLERLHLEYAYHILIGHKTIEVEFKVWN